jgi:hypothetical protein
VWRWGRPSAARSSGRFAYHRDLAKVATEVALDGVYIIRTSLAAGRMSAADCVRSSKSLSRVERAFRTLKSVDLQIRPIHHRLADRVRAHIFLCMLADYVEWRMRQAWAPLLFADEDQAAKLTRDPVALAQRSPGALRKVHARRLDDGTPAHSFSTLLAELAAVTRNTCRAAAAGQAAPTLPGPHGPQPQADPGARTYRRHPPVGGSHNSVSTHPVETTE